MTLTNATTIEEAESLVLSLLRGSDDSTPAYFLHSDIAPLAEGVVDSSGNTLHLYCESCRNQLDHILALVSSAGTAGFIFRPAGVLSDSLCYCFTCGTLLRVHLTARGVSSTIAHYAAIAGAAAPFQTLDEVKILVLSTANGRYDSAPGVIDLVNRIAGSSIEALR